MTAALGTPLNADLVAIARAKLGTQLLRTAELDRLTSLLHQGERVVTLCDALCRSGRQEWRGLTVLTDERLVCLYTGSMDEPPTEFCLSAIASVETGIPRGSGDAKRGELTMRVQGRETRLARVRPWERAAEIAQHITAAIAVRTNEAPDGLGASDAVLVSGSDKAAHVCSKLSDFNPEQPSSEIR
jgi:hypothetical protein